MALNFPDSPTIGDEFVGGGFTWVWTGTTWSKMAASTAGAANDFALLVGATGNTTYVLDRTYTSGRYTIEFTNGDTTYDIYAIAEDGTYAGYTNGAILEVSADFTEIVVLGAAASETVLFNYQGTLTAPSSSGDVATAGAFISSVVTSSLPSIDDTTVVNGGNFAADVAVSFIDQSAVETAAKAVVRSSSTELVVTRPDAFSPDDSPYTVKVVNPGIPVPAGTNAHLLSNAVTAGTNPVWTTDTTIVYNVGGATSVTLLATDTEGTDIDYSVVSGTLPAGLTLDGETGVISGTFSGTASEGDVTAVTIRAVDTGGNFLDKAFNFTANEAPTWTTAAGALENAVDNAAYSFQLVASTGTAGGALTYTLQTGALLPGHTLSSTGLISGTSTGITDDTATFTIRVTDEGGLFADREFNILIAAPSDGYAIMLNPTVNYQGWNSYGDDAKNVYFMGYDYNHNPVSQTIVKASSSGVTSVKALIASTGVAMNAHNFGPQASTGFVATGAIPNSSNIARASCILFDSAGDVSAAFVANSTQSFSSESYNRTPIVDANNYIYNVGWQYVPPAGGYGRYDAIVHKFAPNGTIAWSRAIGDSAYLSDARARSAAVDPAGNVYFSYYSSAESGQFAIAKFDTNGALQWIKRFDLTNAVSGGLVYSNNAIYAVGQAPTGTVLFKLSLDGVLEWSRLTSAGSNTVTIAADSSGNIYFRTHDNQKIIVFKYAPTGTLIWQRSVLITISGDRITLGTSGNDDEGQLNSFAVNIGTGGYELGSVTLGTRSAIIEASNYTDSDAAVSIVATGTSLSLFTTTYSVSSVGMSTYSSTISAITASF